jgi:hypothetical protein
MYELNPHEILAGKPEKIIPFRGVGRISDDSNKICVNEGLSV